MLLLFLFTFSNAVQPQPQADTHRPTNRFRILRTLTVGSTDTVNDVFCIACSVRVGGHVAGDIITIGGSLLAEGPVDGDVIAVGGGVEVRSPGRLSGDVFALGGYVEKTGGGTITRESLAIPYIIIPGQLNPTGLGSAGLAAWNLILVALAYAALRPRRVENTAQALRHRGGSVIFAGLLAVVFFYFANSLCTRLGRSQAVPEIILGAVFVIVAAAGAPGLGFWAANFAFPHTHGAATTLAGIFALTFLEFVPLFGFVIALVGIILSLGAAVVSAFGSRGVAST
jgi:hypothetical protein